jgi:hypothetical protein
MRLVLCVALAYSAAGLRRRKRRGGARRRQAAPMIYCAGQPRSLTPDPLSPHRERGGDASGFGQQARLYLPAHAWRFAWEKLAGGRG